MITRMNRLSTLSLFVGCLALVSRGAPIFAPTAGLAQEEGQIGAVEVELFPIREYLDRLKKRS